MPRLIRLLLVTHYYPDHKGGVEIVAGKLAEQLVKLNINITWMAMQSGFKPAKHGLKCIPATASNIIEEKLHIPYPLWSPGSIIKLWQQVKAADAVHLHDYIYLGNMLAFLFAKLKSKPIIITQHIGFVPYDNALFRIVLSFMNKTFGAFLLSHSSKTIFISDVVKHYFTTGKHYRNHPILIPNGVDISVFRPCNDEQRMAERIKRNLPADRNVFLFVGRFVEKKGLNILKELARTNQGVIWVFAGWGPLNPQSWQLANVVVYKNLTADELQPLYQLADLLVLPSKGEGFPLVVQEAMACGTPAMVGTETSLAVPEATHLLISEDVEGEDVVLKWNKKIKTLIEYPSELKNLRTPAAEFVKQNWSWDKCAAEYAKIIEQIISSPYSRYS